MACFLMTAVPGMATGSAGGQKTPAPFPGIREARIDRSTGVPRLTLDGQPVVPMIFFFNTRQHPGYQTRFLEPQVRRAAEAGIHTYSFLTPNPLYGEDGAPDFTATDREIADFVRADPRALFILRVWPGPNPGWPGWKTIPEGEKTVHASPDPDVRRAKISIASKYFWGPSNTELARWIRHLEDGPYGTRIVGYNIGGPEFEMFPDRYRERGPDISEASTRRFRKWLRGHYSGDAALRRAWGRDSVSLDTASPPTNSNRFPIRCIGNTAPIQIFYRIPEERDWFDYSDFVSDLAAERIVDWAGLVKRETGGKKINIFCYGYNLELCGSINAHQAMERVLDCPDVDVLMAPISYIDRVAGGPAGFMSAVDSIMRRGKLWLNEDDIRTSLIRCENIPPWLTGSTFGEQARDLPETLNLLDRNFAALVTHRAASWWMDLAGGGAFDDPAPWRLLKDRLPLHNAICLDPTPYCPEVALIVDDRSLACIRSDWDAFFWLLTDMRNQCARSGAAVGYYLLNDFISGVVPPCKAYVFANAFRLDDNNIKAIRARLDREKAMAIWCCAPGWMSPDGPDPGRSIRLTGMRLQVRDGNQQCRGEGLLAGESWGEDLDISPRFAVSDADAEPLARYRKDGTVSAARKRRDVFIGSMGCSHGALRRLFREATAHVWTRGGEVVHTDGHLLAIHSGPGGPTEIRAPAGKKVLPIQASSDRQTTGSIVVRFEKGETRWFKVTRSAL